MVFNHVEHQHLSLLSLAGTGRLTESISPMYNTVVVNSIIEEIYNKFRDENADYIESRERIKRSVNLLSYGDDDISLFDSRVSEELIDSILGGRKPLNLTIKEYGASLKFRSLEERIPFLREPSLMNWRSTFAGNLREKSDFFDYSKEELDRMLKSFL